MASAQRRARDKALRAAVAAVARPQGYQGAYPGLRRTVGDHLELIRFEHSKYGGMFFVELGRVPVAELGERAARYLIPVEKVDMAALAHSERRRVRCPPPTTPEVSDLFYYGPMTHWLREDEVEPAEHYDEVAARAVRAIVDQEPSFLEPF